MLVFSFIGTRQEKSTAARLLKKRFSTSAYLPQDVVGAGARGGVHDVAASLQVLRALRRLFTL